MKYLFFFNGQPLLLCCVCCKIAIQDFVTGLHKQNTKHLRFHRRVHRRTITRRYFTESWKNLRDCATFTDGPYPSIFHRELQKDLRDCATTTDGYTDGFSDGQYRRMYAHPEAHACQTHVRLHKYRRIDRHQIPTESPMDVRTSWSARMSDTCPSARIPTDLLTDRKVWRDFRTFLVRITINFRWYYRQNLMSLTTINFHR